MQFYNLIIAICWVALMGFWLVSAIFAKRTVRNTAWRYGLGLRLVIVVILLALIHVQVPAGNGHTLQSVEALGPASTSTPVLILGVLLCVLGVALAIWARAYLGRNWGMPMSLKENPELVTTGPYAYIRNPIYTGFLIAALGSVLANSLLWLVPLVLMGAYFIYSAKAEEKILAKEFPDTYPAYKARTKMLVPFVF